MKTVPEMLREGAATYEERNKLYGDNYKRFGHFALHMLGEVELKSSDDFSRFAILVQIIGKVSRYCENFKAGGHDDSLLDLAVYATMLRELDEEERQYRTDGNGASSGVESSRGTGDRTGAPQASWRDAIAK